MGTLAIEFSHQEARALLYSSQLALEVSGFIGLSDDATALDWAQLKLATALDDVQQQGRA